MTSPVEALHRKTLAVVMTSQVFSGAGLAAGVTVGALLAADMLGTNSLSGLPVALFTAGSAGTAYLVGRISQRHGRRAGLTVGYTTGAIGSAGVVLAAAVDNVSLLMLFLLVYGAGNATNLQARYAGADLVGPERRGRAVSSVLVATTLGAVAGPNLVAITGDAARHWGIPALAGPFGLAAVAYAAAAAVLFALLRPDPLQTSQRLAAAAPPSTDISVPAAGASVPVADISGPVAGAPVPVADISVPAAGASVPVADASVPAAGTSASATGTSASAAGATRFAGGLVAGAVTMVLTQIVMVAVMTMTPVHMQTHGHDLAATGLVIAVHIGAMYLPSPLTGLLADRYGRVPVAVAAGLTLLAAGIVAATAPDTSVAGLGLALGLLGLGWNLGLVAGTAMVSDAVPPQTHAKTQGTIDVCIALSGAGAGIGSGVILSATSYAALSLGGGAIALIGIVLIARRR